jgi:HEAT repeat protein
MTLRKETVDVLCRLVQTGDEADRCYAARTLGILGDTASVDTLIEHLKDEDIDVAIDATEALGNIGSVEAVPALIESLENDSSGEVCTMAAEALGKIGSSASIEPLLEIMMQRPEYLEWDDDWDTWWDVQKEAVKALGMLKADKAVDSMASLLDDEGQQDIEPDILNTLILISDAGEAHVIARLQNQDSLTLHRRRAAHALATSSTQDSTKALGRALKDAAPEVRAEAALALAEKNAASYLSALVLLLRDPSEEVRQAAITAVIQLAEDGANASELQEALNPMLSDPDSRVRATLFTALLPVVVNNPMSEQNFQAVVDCTTDDAAETATAACTLLGANADPTAIAALLLIIDNPGGHPMVRREAAVSVGKLGQISAPVIDTLGRTVADKQQTVRLAALTALMELENSGTLMESDKNNPVPRPLDIVMDAIHGNVTNVDDAHSEASRAVTEKEETEESTLPTEAKGLASESADSQETQNSAPGQPSESLTLPETPAQIVQEGEVTPAISTLEAIAMQNVEAMLNGPGQEEEIQDEVTQEYMQIVENNKDQMRRIRSNRKINVHQDIRRMAARVLAETDEPLAVDILVKALNDDDGLVRREAAEAIGVIAQRNSQTPGLMDAIGTLITQMAVGDIDQKVTCARTLSYLGNRAALPPLMDATRAPESTLRVHAIDALTRLSLNNQDPESADHMVIRDVPPLSIARKLMESLDDEDMGTRVAAVKGLAQILKTLNEESFTRKAINKAVSSVTVSTGEEARLLGKALRQFDTSLCNEELLTQLKSAEDSVKRSVFIEMIEELLQPEQSQSEHAA